MSTAPLCMECGDPAALTDGREIYPHRPDLHSKPFWKCRRCPSSYTGCHDGTTVAKGRPAGKFTRDRRILAHAFFDRLWKAKMARDGIPQGKARGLAYKWLAEQLGIKPRDCHIGEMDAETATRVADICAAYGRPK